MIRICLVDIHKCSIYDLAFTRLDVEDKILEELYGKRLDRIDKIYLKGNVYSDIYEDSLYSFSDEVIIELLESLRDEFFKDDYKVSNNINTYVDKVKKGWREYINIVTKF